jgi:hypothetical protein
MKRTILLLMAVLAGLVAAGCGSSSGGATTQSARTGANQPEVSPAGDIPDNQAYVRFAPSGGGFSVKVPEGWSRTATGGAVVFTDKLNAIRVESQPAQRAASVADAKRAEVPRLQSSVPGFQAGRVTTVTRHAGPGVLIAYQADAPVNPVTGKGGTDAVERYVFFHAGHRVVLTLSGPKGADNVDPWRIVTDSLSWGA